MQPLFQSNIPLINLVSNQMYYQIDGILLASFKYGKRHFGYEELAGGIGANQKWQNILNE